MLRPADPIDTPLIRSILNAPENWRRRRGPIADALIMLHAPDDMHVND